MKENRLQIIEDFKKYLERRHPGNGTAVNYVSDVNQFAAACPKEWREVSMHDIDDFVDQQRQRLSVETVNRHVAALKIFFDFLAEESNDLSWPNPVRYKRHTGKTAKKLPRDLSDEQVTKLWSVITSPRDKAWFALMLRAGLRVGEVISLTIAALISPATTEQPARLRISGKGQKERIVLLSADAYAVVQAWLEIRPECEHEQIFLNGRGKPLQANGIQYLMRQYGKQVGFKVSPHNLRHTFARQLTEAEMAMPSLSKLMGHSDPRTTLIYTAGADPQLAQAYQEAMTKLEDGTVPPEADPDLPPPPPPAPNLPPPPPPPLPDLKEWAPDLEPALRQASLDLVQRRLPGWKPQRRPKQIGRVLSELKAFWRWQLAFRPITDPTELLLADLRAYQQARLEAGKATSTINHTLDFVLAILRHLADQGQPVDASVFRLKDLPRPDALPRHLSETDACTLETFTRQRLATSDPLIRLENACFFVLAHTGLRASELVDLQLQDLDFNSGRLFVRLGKGQRDRIVYLSQTCQLALSLYLRQLPPQPTTALWVQPSGRPVTIGWLYRRIVALGLAAGNISVSPHRLRHTLATRLLNAGMNITRIQKLLGHDHLNTTMIYARVLDKTLEADYRQAMLKIEAQQLPLSTTPELITNWPTTPITDLPSPQEVETVIFDNSL